MRSMIKETDNYSASYDYDREDVQIKFTGKPSENIRSILKYNSFRWNPTSMVWKRYETGKLHFTKKALRSIDDQFENELKNKNTCINE